MNSSLRFVLVAAVVVVFGGCGPGIIETADSGVGGGSGGGSGGGTGGGSAKDAGGATGGGTGGGVGGGMGGGMGGGSGSDAGGNSGVDAGGNTDVDAGGAPIDAGGGTITDAGGGTTTDAGGGTTDAGGGTTTDAGGTTTDAGGGATTDAGGGSTTDAGGPVDAGAPSPIGLLTLSKSGRGDGAIFGAGINCGDDCTENFLKGTQVTLTAYEDSQSVFIGWSGSGCNGTAPCTVTVGSATTVNAEFASAIFPVTVVKLGNGTGKVTGTGVDCGSDCSAAIVSGGSLALLAEPDTGMNFDGWFNAAGQCGFNPDCNLTVTSSMSPTVYFSKQSYYFDLSGPSTASGKVTGSGFDCTGFATCRQVFNYGDVVTLTATPRTGYYFAGWTGDCLGQGQTCTHTVTGYTSTGPKLFAYEYSVSVVKTGTGAGFVQSSPAGINCGFGCTMAARAYGTVITLTATANAGSTFMGWSGGGCSGTADCTFTLTGDTNIEAAFSGPTSVLTVAKTGTGTGTVTGTGITCGADCTESVATGANVTLTATPDVGSTFVGFTGGGCGTTSPCVVTVGSSTTVTAIFGLPQFSLTVTKTGTGADTSTVTGGGIACGSTCSASLDVGTMVTLTANPAAGASFDGWSGACTGMGTCTVTMSAARTVNAQFTAPVFTLTVARQGAGLGHVTSDLSGIDCGVDCTERYSVNTAVLLTAEPDSGSIFLGFGAPCVGTAPTCLVTITAATTVVATFAPATVPLQVSRDGTGTGVVTSAPVGINCGADCSEDVNYGATMNLSAIASADSTFTGWSGGPCTGTGVCTISMTALTSVTANFALSDYALNISKIGLGDGTVSSSPAGLSCGSSCSVSFVSGTLVTLVATPSPGSAFAGWSGGGCAGTGTCSVYMNAVANVTADFTLQQYTLSVSKPGPGSGTVTSTGAGINCGTDCSEAYTSGTVVQLSAVKATGSTFTGWSGGGCSGTGTCTVTMNSANGTAVSATFALVQYTLTTTRSGTYGGTISGAGISCPNDCTEPIAYGSTVTLNANADAFNTFFGWSGGPCTGTGQCTFVVDGDATVNAAFAPKQYPLTVSSIKLGTATGTISSTPAGINCGADCTENYDYGTSVLLYVTPTAGMVFGGWTGACKGLGTCAVTVNQATAVGAIFGEQPNMMFVTSTSYTGAIGGLVGADSICQARAIAGGLTGTYKAWLSSSSTSAISRLGNASGWVRRDGLPVFNTQADLTAGRVQYLPVLTESNLELADPFVTTATASNGQYTAISLGTACGDWTLSDTSRLSVGRPRVSDGQWTNANTVTCASALPLFCFGIDRQGIALVAPTANRRMAFVSSSGFDNPIGGLAAADAICSSEATSAGLPGTYKALLAGNGVTSASRFTTTGHPWARVDGVALSPTAAGFFTGANWYSGLNLSASGGLSVANTQVWGGATTPQAAGSAATTCADWSGGTNGTAGISGKSIVTEAFGTMTRPCSLNAPAVRVYCLQE